MDEMLARLWENLGGRIGGPLSFRLILQPTIAIVLAIKAGLSDAQAEYAVSRVAQDPGVLPEAGALALGQRYRFGDPVGRSAVGLHCPCRDCSGRHGGRGAARPVRRAQGIAGGKPAACECQRTARRTAKRL